MGIVRKLDKKLPDWRQSPVMIKLMARDKIRDQKAIKKYQEKIKKSI